MTRSALESVAASSSSTSTEELPFPSKSPVVSEPASSTQAVPDDHLADAKRQSADGEHQQVAAPGEPEAREQDIEVKVVKLNT